MAKRKFRLEQEVKFNGVVSKIVGSYECEEAEIQAIIEKLGGVVTVMEENTTLSSPAETSNLVTGGLPIESIWMSHSDAKSKVFGSYGKPFLFKETVGVVELQQLFKLHKPFSGAYEAEVPDSVKPVIGNMADLM
jgi:hypothetical protein